MSIEDDARKAVDAAAGTGPQAMQPRHRDVFPTLMTALHGNLSRWEGVLARMLPVLERAALNPQADQAVEVIMTMAGMGAEAHEFQAIIDLGSAVIARRQAAPQPQFLPAPAGTAQPEGAA
jgi:hypothetical protein